MSDVPHDLIEAAKSRDARFRIIDEGFAVQAEMRETAPGPGAPGAKQGMVP